MLKEPVGNTDMVRIFVFKGGFVKIQKDFFF